MSRYKHTFPGFADRLRQVTKEKRLTQIKAAQLLGISNFSFNNYCRGSTPKIEILLKISEFFGKPIEWFLTGKGDIEENIAKNIAKLPDDTSGHDFIVEIWLKELKPTKSTKKT